jgi:hypothetical protein
VIEGPRGFEPIASYGMLSDCSWRLAPRPEYGLVRPLLRMTDGGARTFGGPNQIALSSSTALVARDAGVHADFTVAASERAGFCLMWALAERLEPQTCRHDEVAAPIADTVAAWRSWGAEHDIYQGLRREMLRLSSPVLKGLSYRPTGYRGQVGLNDDGLRGEEGTFVICSFWLAQCLVLAGEVGRAERLFERLAGFANDLG